MGSGCYNDFGNHDRRELQSRMVHSIDIFKKKKKALCQFPKAAVTEYQKPGVFLSLRAVGKDSSFPLPACETILGIPWLIDSSL